MANVSITTKEARAIQIVGRAAILSWLFSGWIFMLMSGVLGHVSGRDGFFISYYAGIFISLLFSFAMSFVRPIPPSE